jgi:hypothetical protein
MLGVDQFDLQTPLNQDFVDRDPIDAGGLHRHGFNPAGLEPIGQDMQISGEGQEGPDVRFGPVLRHTGPDFSRAHIQASGIEVNAVQGVEFGGLRLLFFHLTAP